MENEKIVGPKSNETDLVINEFALKRFGLKSAFVLAALIECDDIMSSLTDYHRITIFKQFDIELENSEYLYFPISLSSISSEFHIKITQIKKCIETLENEGIISSIYIKNKKQWFCKLNKEKVNAIYSGADSKPSLRIVDKI